MIKGEILKALIIFDKKTGNPYINYFPDKDFNMDPNLIINFLTSVLDFSKKFGQNLKMFDMESFRLVFTEKQDIVFNAISNRLVNPMDILFKLNTIQSIFLNEFSEDILSNPDIPSNYFDNFLKKIDEIINGDLRVLKNKPKIKKVLDTFHKKDFVMGSGLLSFAGNFLVSTFNKADTILIQSLFNSYFEMIVAGINKAIIEFLNRTFYIKKIDDQTLFVVIIKNDKEFKQIESEIEKVRENLKVIVKTDS
ncbi:MAG: hypothetical protein ACFFDN_06340 [Candidatus Hodarchaeota archaeon]